MARTGQYQFTSPEARRLFTALPDGLGGDMSVLMEFLSPPLETSFSGWTIDKVKTAAQNELLNVRGVTEQDRDQLNASVTSVELAINGYYDDRVSGRTPSGDNLVRTVQANAGIWQALAARAPGAAAIEALATTAWKYVQAAAVEIEGKAGGRLGGEGDPAVVFYDIDKAVRDDWVPAQPNKQALPPYPDLSRVVETPVVETPVVEPIPDKPGEIK